MTGPILAFDKVGMTFRVGGRHVHALTAVDLTIEPGECHLR